MANKCGAGRSMDHDNMTMPVTKSHTGDGKKKEGAKKTTGKKK